MKVGQVYITGIGSVSAFGPVQGLIRQGTNQIRAIKAWPTKGLRRAYLVEPFVPSEIVPGLKTRRLDRLSIWALVASSLALKDARVDLRGETRSRCAVVFGTGFGPMDLTASFCGSVADSGCNKADAIVFAETLDNSAASHVARIFGLKGPNVTLTCRGLSGEAAIIQAASILKCGEADLVITMAGDTLIRALFEWYESVGLLSLACYGDRTADDNGSPIGNGFVPGEGLAAFVMESGNRYLERGARVYGRYRSGCMGGDPTTAPFSWGTDIGATVNLIHKALGSAIPSDVRLIVSAGNGSTPPDAMETKAIREVFGSAKSTAVVAPKLQLGEFDGNALLRLTVALSDLPGCVDAAVVSSARSCVEQGRDSESCDNNMLLLLGASTGGGRAALTLESTAPEPMIS